VCALPEGSADDTLARMVLLDPTDPTDPPWWWLRSTERTALGLGLAVERTAGGFVFGAPGAARVEITARCDDAPVKLGSAALRLWGQGLDGSGRALLASVARVLVARKGPGFAPESISLDALVAGSLRPSDETSTIVDVPTICDRACVFCHMSATPPASRRPRGTDAEVEAAIDRAPAGELLFTGDDALSHPRIVELVARARGRGLRPALIGPPRLGVTPALAAPLAEAGLLRYQTAIFGVDAAAHDAIAGRAGAFAAMVEACASLRGAGIAVELVTPLIAPILPSLAALQGVARAHAGAPATLLTYVPDSMVGDRFDWLVPPYEALRSALASLGANAPADLRLADALPLCVLPPPMRARAPRRLARTDLAIDSSWPDASCAACAQRSGCPGVPSTVARAVGASGLVTLGALVTRVTESA
jgi:hypothetical protein